MTLLRGATLCAAIACLLELILSIFRVFHNNISWYIAHGSGLGIAEMVVPLFVSISLTVFFFALYSKQKA